jgi:NAD(P)-dependent dehydrogenase (short-subunit alcohol dehydrogenase family)
MNSSTLTAPTVTRSERLLGRKVLVTGSSKGIGRGIAIRLAQEGADVVINYNSDPLGAEEALAEVHALGRRGAIIRANLGAVAEVRDLVAQSAEALGGLDVLVNNAGIEKHAPFWAQATSRRTRSTLARARPEGSRSKSRVTSRESPRPHRQSRPQRQGE